MWKASPLSICAALLQWAACPPAEAADSAAAVAPSLASGATPSPDFESLRIKGLNLPLPGLQDTIDPDVAGIRSSLASLGIGYIDYSNNSLFDNMLPATCGSFSDPKVVVMVIVVAIVGLIILMPISRALADC